MEGTLQAAESFRGPVPAGGLMVTAYGESRDQDSLTVDRRVSQKGAISGRGTVTKVAMVTRITKAWALRTLLRDPAEWLQTDPPLSRGAEIEILQIRDEAKPFTFGILNPRPLRPKELFCWLAAFESKRTPQEPVKP